MNNPDPDTMVLPDLKELGGHLLAAEPAPESAREQLMNSLDHEWIRCGRDQAPLAVLAIKVEGLARFRNASGPDAAANCLKAVVALVRIFCIRRRDRVFRDSEEGFIAILPDTHTEGAGHVANRIANGVRDLQLAPGDFKALDVASVSIGGSVAVPGKAGSAADLLRRAEDALATARSRGEIWIAGDRPAPTPQQVEKPSNFSGRKQNPDRRRSSD